MRLLTKTEAAEYCRVSLATFERVCPVRPIALQPGNPRLLRYDVRDLDNWIDVLKGKAESERSVEADADDYLARLDT